MVKYNAGRGLSGGISGAATGSAFGPVGTAVGGVVGLAAGLFGNKKKKPKKKSSLDPQQQGLYNDYVNGLRGQGPMANLYNFDAQGYNDVFDKTIGRQAYRNFEENVIPKITGQFRSNNLMQSSYAGGALARAGRDVQENLDAQRSANIFQGQQQANQNRASGVESALNRQTFAYQKPETGGGIDSILNQLAPQAGEWFADFIKQKRNGAGPTASPTMPVAA